MATKVPGAGDLRSFIRVDRRRDADDGLGNKKGDWAELIDRRSAKLSAMRGNVEVLAHRLAGSSPFDLWVRADRLTKTVSTSDRVVDITEPQTLRFFRIKWAEVIDEAGGWVLMSLEAMSGNDRGK